jgi:hypothetical protein
MTETNFRALCEELLQELCCCYKPWELKEGSYSDAMKRANAALAQPKPAPTDEELIGPIMWMLDDCVYDNDKGEIAQSLRRLIARWGTPANNTREEI